MSCYEGLIELVDPAVPLSSLKSLDTFLDLGEKSSVCGSELRCCR